MIDVYAAKFLLSSTHLCKRYVSGKRASYELELVLLVQKYMLGLFQDIENDFNNLNISPLLQTLINL